MKFKYYIRGFGMGVIFATVMLMLTLAIKDNMPSEKNKHTNSSGNLDMENKTSSKSETTKNSENANGQEHTQEKEDVTKDKNDTHSETTTQEKNTVPEENTTTEETSQALPPESETVPDEENVFTLNITQGMSSNEAADILETHGVVESGHDFNMYLYNNGYERKLKIGSYQIKAGLSYEEIAKIITGL